MPFPDLSHLPAWAQVLVYAILGLSLGIAFIVARFGVNQGQKAAPAASSGTAQVAAVIVDPTALNRLTATGEALNTTLTEMNMIGREAAKVHAEDVKVMSALRDEMDRIREEMRIQREINRR